MLHAPLPDSNCIKTGHNIAPYPLEPSIIQRIRAGHTYDVQEACKVTDPAKHASGYRPSAKPSACEDLPAKKKKKE